MKKYKEIYDITMTIGFGVLTVFSLYNGKTDYSIISLILMLNYKNNLKDKD